MSWIVLVTTKQHNLTASFASCGRRDMMWDFGKKTTVENRYRIRVLIFKTHMIVGIEGKNKKPSISGEGFKWEPRWRYVWGKHLVLPHFTPKVILPHFSDGMNRWGKGRGALRQIATPETVVRSLNFLQLNEEVQNRSTVRITRVNFKVFGNM